jgi:hypothetical protein
MPSVSIHTTTQASNVPVSPGYCTLDFTTSVLILFSPKRQHPQQPPPPALNNSTGSSLPIHPHRPEPTIVEVTLFLVVELA